MASTGNAAMSCFNPRSRMGSDLVALPPPPLFKVSIHAPAWGATFLINAQAEEVIAFQSTLPHGERHHANHANNSRQLGFNPRSRMGSDDSARQSSWTRGGFNPRSRMGSDPPRYFARSTAIGFNPRSRMGSDLLPLAISAMYMTFQSTLPHGERPNTSQQPFWIYTVSIHAPAWGATGVAVSVMIASFVSIHAPAWGATDIAVIITLEFGQFQSTLPHGERLAPRRCSAPPDRRFNPRSRMGSDRQPQAVYPDRHKFQSTLPHGERHGLSAVGHRRRCFNPRSRMGSDLPNLSADLVMRPFQSTLPHGERLATQKKPVVDALFQSTLPHGERPRRPP